MPNLHNKTPESLRFHTRLLLWVIRTTAPSRHKDVRVKLFVNAGRFSLKSDASILVLSIREGNLGDISRYVVER